MSREPEQGSNRDQMRTEVYAPAVSAFLYLLQHRLRLSSRLLARDGRGGIGMVKHAYLAELLIDDRTTSEVLAQSPEWSAAWACFFRSVSHRFMLL